MDNLLVRTPKQGDRQLKLERSLAHNNTRPLKEIRFFKALSSTFFISHRLKPPS